MSAAGVPLASAMREQHVFDGDEGIAGLLRQLLGLVEQASGFRRQVDLTGAAALDLRELARARARPPASTCCDPGAARLDQVARRGVLIVEQRLEHVQRRELLMPAAQRQRFAPPERWLLRRSVYFSICIGSSPSIAVDA